MAATTRRTLAVEVASAYPRRWLAALAFAAGLQGRGIRQSERGWRGRLWLFDVLRSHVEREIRLGDRHAGGLPHPLPLPRPCQTGLLVRRRSHETGKRL